MAFTSTMPTELSMTVSTLDLDTLSPTNYQLELSNWLINAFNGEWLRTANAVPLQIDAAERKV
jgi:hypothetical protein